MGSNLSFIGLTRYVDEVLDCSLKNVPLGGGFTCDPLLIHYEKTFIDPYLEEVLWLLEEISRNHAYESHCSLVSSENGNASKMGKKWTKENYIFPKNRELLPWVEERIYRKTYKCCDDDSLLDLEMDVGPSYDWFIHPIIDNEWLCSPFNRDCQIPMYKCLFSPNQ
ncbi:hypothetical protein TSUD_164510 [Trifolium subterraneum]|uniref:Uncharacterized protein n=1 Tax=Trifolium subterraneum TaxID=3900 RepID=A0A2Z6MIE4_TRISU|nr:hypothetical protein TSUD_164510 [Trifolium subterraneum]